MQSAGVAGFPFSGEEWGPVACTESESRPAEDFPTAAVEMAESSGPGRGLGTG